MENKDWILTPEEIVKLEKSIESETQTIKFIDMNSKDLITLERLEEKQKSLKPAQYGTYLLIEDVIDLIIRQQAEIDRIDCEMGKAMLTRLDNKIEGVHKMNKLEDKVVESRLTFVGSVESIVEVKRASGILETRIVNNTEIDGRKIAFFNMVNRNKLTVAYLEAKQATLLPEDYSLYMLLGDSIDLIYNLQAEIDELR